MKYVNAYIVKLYNFIISRKWINKNNPVCRKIRKMLFHNICYECKCRFGKLNADKEIYIIRCPQEKMGLFGVFNYVVHHLKLAEKNGLVPVIDWQYYPNSSMLEDSLVGKENVWDYFWEQPGRISLDEAYHSKNVTMSSGAGMSDGFVEIHNPELIAKTHRLVDQYVKLNQQTAQYVEQEYLRLDMKDSKVLGVRCRGTDFKLSPKFHAIVPTLDETITKIEEKQKEWGVYEKILLATEDEDIFQSMLEYFDEKLIYVQGGERHKVDELDGKWLVELYNKKNYRSNKRKVMLEYLTSVYLLARCDALIVPCVGGAMASLWIRGNCEKCFVFELGINS